MRAVAVPSIARRVLVALGLVGLVVAIMVVFAPSTPAFAECKPDGVPDHAGSGVLGMIDPDPGVVYGELPGGYTYSGLNNYDVYGWSGFLWHTCDIAGDWNMPDVMALIDTWIGNAFMGLAVGEAAILSALHNWTMDPSPILKPIDDRITELSTITVDLVFGEWAWALLVFAGITVLVASLTRSVRTSLMTVVAILGSLAFISLVQTAPLTVAKAMDGVAGSIIGAVDAAALQYAQIPEERDSSDACSFAAAPYESATAVLYNEGILQPMWRMGQTGTSDCMDTTVSMFQAATVGWQEAREGYSVDDKRDEYNEAVEAVKNNDQIANQYQTIKGQSYNRAGAGAISMVMMTIIFLIRGPAEAYIFLGLLVLRFVPILGPIFAALAIPEPTRGAAVGAVKIVAASVFNVIVFGIIAAVHTVLTMRLYMDTTNIIATTLLSLLLTFLLLKLSKPYRSVTKLATGSQVSAELANAPDAPANAAKTAVGFATGTAVGVGANMWQNHQNKRREKQQEKAAERRIERVERAHGGPDRGGEVHPGWKQAPNINPAWAKTPDRSHDTGKSQSSGEESTGQIEALDAPSMRQSPQQITVDPGETVMMPSDIGNSELIEPEFEQGRIVTNIFVPGESATTVETPYNQSAADQEYSVRGD